VDENTKAALDLLVTSSQSLQVRERAAKLLTMHDTPSTQVTLTARMALSEPQWTHEQLKLIGGLLAVDPPPEDRQRSATLPAVRVYPDERDAAEQLAVDHGMTLAEWIRHRVTNTLGEVQARETGGKSRART
jgi:hypothetical protein